jgi:hypothetical protein
MMNLLPAVVGALFSRLASWFKQAGSLFQLRLNPDVQ